MHCLRFNQWYTNDKSFSFQANDLNEQSAALFSSGHAYFQLSPHFMRNWMPDLKVLWQDQQCRAKAATVVAEKVRTSTQVFAVRFYAAHSGDFEGKYKVCQSCKMSDLTSHRNVWAQCSSWPATHFGIGKLLMALFGSNVPGCALSSEAWERPA